MSTFATTKMSSKGQVVIPEEIRTRLQLEPGTRFIVVGEGDTIISKKTVRPPLADFDVLITKARRQARSAGVKRSDITATLKGVRGAKERWCLMRQ